VGFLQAVLRLERLLADPPRIVATPRDRLEALARGRREGELDAAIEAYTLEYRRASHGVLGFTPVRILLDASPDLLISTRRDWPERVGTLNRGIAAITKEEMAALYRRRLGADYQRRVEAERIEVAGKEQAWLASHEVLRAGLDSSWAPVGRARRRAGRPPGHFRGVTEAPGGAARGPLRGGQCL
jgi:hypothetical protein